mmetsp:Transcript_28154/g.82954  ORF Transcript_28154/g.82954 Transcript_28154/m.82954 type:complete len:282 (-) Transcript_28154:951-1796(-)
MFEGRKFLGGAGKEMQFYWRYIDGYGTHRLDGIPVLHVISPVPIAPVSRREVAAVRPEDPPLHRRRAGRLGFPPVRDGATVRVRGASPVRRGPRRPRSHPRPEHGGACEGVCPRPSPCGGSFVRSTLRAQATPGAQSTTAPRGRGARGQREAGVRPSEHEGGYWRDGRGEGVAVRADTGGGAAVWSMLAAGAAGVPAGVAIAAIIATAIRARGDGAIPQGRGGRWKKEAAGRPLAPSAIFTSPSTRLVCGRVGEGAILFWKAGSVTRVVEEREAGPRTAHA